MNRANIFNISMYIYTYNGKVFMMKRIEMCESYEHLKILEVYSEENEKAKPCITSWFSDSNIKKYTYFGNLPTSPNLSS